MHKVPSHGSLAMSATGDVSTAKVKESVHHV